MSLSGSGGGPSAKGACLFFRLSDSSPHWEVPEIAPYTGSDTTKTNLTQWGTTMSVGSQKEIKCWCVGGLVVTLLCSDHRGADVGTLGGASGVGDA